MQTLQLVERHAWDGGDRQTFHGECFPNSREMVEKLKVQFPHDALVPQTLLVFSDLHDWKQNRPEQIRARAIAKLTPEEIHILGIKL